MNYFLDLSDDNIWLIKRGEERYNLGKKEDVLEIIKLLNQ